MPEQGPDCFFVATEACGGETSDLWTPLGFLEYLGIYRAKRRCGRPLMTHKYRGSIVVLSISKSVKPNEEQKEMTSGFQQGNFCKH